MELWSLWSEAQLLVHVRFRGSLHPPKDSHLDARELDLRVLVSWLLLHRRESFTDWIRAHHKLGIPVFTCWWFSVDNSLWQTDQGESELLFFMFPTVIRMNERMKHERERREWKIDNLVSYPEPSNNKTQQQTHVTQFAFSLPFVSKNLRPF